MESMKESMEKERKWRFSMSDSMSYSACLFSSFIVCSFFVVCFVGCVFHARPERGIR
jgi:hypothetical protein